MVLTEGILLGMVAALCWGIADFFAKIVTDKIGAFKALLIMQIIGLIPLGLYSVFVLQIPLISIEMGVIIVLVSILYVAGYLLYYKAIEKGQVSIVTPIASSWAVITALLAIIIFNEVLTLFQVSAILIILFGIFLTSVVWSEFVSGVKGKLVRGAKEAIASALTWGIVFVLAKSFIGAYGHIITILFMRSLCVLFMSTWSGYKRIKFNITSTNIWLLLLAIGLFDVTAFLATTGAFLTEYVSVISPISATYPAVTVILAYIFLKERIAKNQVIGIGLILLGLVMISIV